MKTTTQERGWQSIERAVSSINKDPSAPHQLSDLAALAGYSENRFHKVFRALIGETVGAYVKRIRLQYAVRLLRSAPDMTLTDVALLSGHSELSDFSRSFKAAFSIAPSQWDRKSTLNYDKNCQAHADRNQYIWDDLSPMPASQEKEVSIVHLPPMRLAVLRIPHPTAGDNLLHGFNELDDWLSAQTVDRSRQFWGLTHADTYSAGVEPVYFDLAHIAPANIEPSRNVIIRELPEFTGACVCCEGDLTAYISAWDYLERRWLPNSDYLPTRIPKIEKYHNDPRTTNMKYWEMDCIFPIKKDWVFDE